MNSKNLKLIACISMVLDHIGYIIFPGVTIWRILGRLAFPIFAFFIGEGCARTRNIKRYFTRLLVFGAVIQLFYVIFTLLTEGKISPGSSCLHMNIMLTFALSVAVCAAYLRLEACVKQGASRSERLASAIVFAAVLLGVLALGIFLDNSRSLIGYSLSIDYSTVGALLPLFSVILRESRLRVPLFAVGILFVCLAHFATIGYIWFALAALPLLLLYNGEAGRSRFRY